MMYKTGVKYIMKAKIRNSNRIDILSKPELLGWVSKIRESEENSNNYEPDIGDLYELYRRVRISRAIAIQEFGSGWSTLVLARALSENRRIDQSEVKSSIRHPNPYSLMTVDVSEFFQKIALSRCENYSEEITIIPVISKSNMSLVNR